MALILILYIFASDLYHEGVRQDKWGGCESTFQRAID